MKFTKVCAWCDHIIAYGDPIDAPITHGICEKCLLKHFGVTKAELFAAHEDDTLRGGPRPRGD